MDRNELKQDIEQVVAAIFSEKEEADVRRMTEEALEQSAKTITDLTTSLEERNTELSEFEEKFTESESKVSDLETELEAARKEIETFTDKLSETETALEEMKKDRATELRMSELADSGIISNEEAQTAKVREMSDEDFTAYKDELLALRAAVEAELKASVKEEEKEEAEEKVEEEAAEEEEAEEKPAAEEEAEENKEEEAAEEEAAEEEDVTPPANINPAHAAMASMNMEIIPDADLVSKYAELGQAMAAQYNTDKTE